MIASTFEGIEKRKELKHLAICCLLMGLLVVLLVFLYENREDYIEVSPEK